MTLFASLSGYALWFLAMGRTGIARIAVFQFLQPVLSVIATALVLGEQITVIIVFSGALILLGTRIAQKHARQELKHAQQEFRVASGSRYH